MAMNALQFKSELHEQQAVAEILSDRESSDLFSSLQTTNMQPIDLEKLRNSWVDYTHNKRRVAPRYHLSIPILVSTHKKIFRSHSVNISAVGVLLQEALPEDFSKEKSFDVIFIDDRNKQSKKFLIFKGRCVQNGANTNRIVFELQNADCERLLFGLIEDLTAC